MYLAANTIHIDHNETDLNTIESHFSNVLELGGQFAPTNCKSKYRVAVIIPYRNRSQQLPILLNNIHPFMMKQKIDYGVFLVEQMQGLSFNKASVMNAGFMESMAFGDWNCFIFHDIDLLPMDGRNIYTCDELYPRHMSVAVDTLNFT